MKTRGGTYAHMRSAPYAAEAPVICVYMSLKDSSKILHNFQKLAFLVNNLPFEVKLIFSPHKIVSYFLLHHRMKMSDFSSKGTQKQCLNYTLNSLKEFLKTHSNNNCVMLGWGCECANG